METELTTNEQKEMMQVLTANATTLRREVIQKLLQPQKDIDLECGYPSSISSADYKAMFDRFGLATRLVKIYPEECWSEDPEVFETEDSNETEFEKELAILAKAIPIWTYLLQIDILSGVGQYGIVLLGLDDLHDQTDNANALATPVAGVNPETGLPKGNGRGKAVKTKLLFLKTLDETSVSIKECDRNPASPRFGFPKLYELKLEGEPGSDVRQSYAVHHTRVLHVADNCFTSEVFGVPRLQNVYNHLMDIRKVGGGSGEMFWRGGFPGYAFELTPEAAQAGATIDTESVKEQMMLWAQGLQRWLSLTGVTAKSLAPQVADPKSHVETFIKMCAITEGIPWRLLLGTEEAKLASSQDKKTWNARLSRRQNKYLSPRVIRPFIRKLINVGVLPEPKTEFFVKWPDLNAPGKEDIAKVAQMLTEALAKYVTGSVDQLIPPREFLTMVCKFSDDEAKTIEKALNKYMDELEREQDEEEESVIIRDEDEDEEDTNT